MKRKMTDKELGEKLIQVFAGYDAPVRSLVQEAARRLIDSQKTCNNCRYDENPFDEDLPCYTCISGVVEGVRFAPTKWEPKEG